jgi:uncharacterized phage-like protein YoqJ
VSLFGLNGSLFLNKTCAFLGNDYDTILGRKCGHNTPTSLKERIKEEIINLIENEGVTEFLVGELGGYEIDAYDTVLEVQKEYPNIRVILVISKITELHEVGERDRCNKVEKRGCDDFILPDRCATGYRRLSIVYRNRYIIEHTDFIIAYNKYEGRAYEFCEAAKGKGVKIIELANP